jgi:hypothetical protein
MVSLKQVIKSAIRIQTLFWSLAYSILQYVWLSPSVRCVYVCSRCLRFFLCLDAVGTFLVFQDPSSSVRGVSRETLFHLPGNPSLFTHIPTRVIFTSHFCKISQRPASADHTPVFCMLWFAPQSMLLPSTVLSFHTIRMIHSQPYTVSSLVGFVRKTDVLCKHRTSIVPCVSTSMSTPAQSSVPCHTQRERTSVHSYLSKWLSSLVCEMRLLIQLFVTITHIHWHNSGSAHW